MQRNEDALPVSYSSGIASWIERFLDLVSAFFLLLMMLVTCTDVVGRYVFHSPLSGAYESNELMLLIIVFIALPRVSWQGKHLTVSLIDSLLTPRSLRLQDIIISVVSACILAMFAQALWQHAVQLAGYGDVTNTLNVPLAPLAYLVAVLAYLSALASLMRPWFFRQNASTEQAVDR